MERKTSDNLDSNLTKKLIFCFRQWLSRVSRIRDESPCEKRKLWLFFRVKLLLINTKNKLWSCWEHVKLSDFFYYSHQLTLRTTRRSSCHLPPTPYPPVFLLLYFVYHKTLCNSAITLKLVLSFYEMQRKKTSNK